MQITNQKKMAAQILKCGVNRVWINPSYLDQVAQSVQKEDIREAIDNGWIKAKAIQGTSRVRAKKIKEQKAKDAEKAQGKGLVLLTQEILESNNGCLLSGHREKHSKI